MKVLLAIDHSPATEKVVKFAANYIAAANDVSATLVHVVECLPDFVLQRSEALKQLSQEWRETAREEGESLLEQTRKSLVDAGVDSSCLETKLIIKDALPEAKKVVAALAIIEEMKSGDYEMICLGRRGTALPGGTFVGSVAEKVLREASDRVVCVID